MNGMGKKFELRRRGDAKRPWSARSECNEATAFAAERRGRNQPRMNTDSHGCFGAGCGEAMGKGKPPMDTDEH
jgi:hypothetical protein